jgi:RES domain-containing protein
LKVGTIHLKRRCWRMLAPKWAYQPLSGVGAASFGGRFNELGLPALYLSEDYITAIAEYEQDLGIRPGTLCAYDIDMGGIVDLTLPEIQAAFDISRDTLHCPWKEYWLVQKQRPPTWDLASQLVAQGYNGIRVPSVQHFNGVNLVLWHWNDSDENKVIPLDPRGDLPANQESWQGG